MLIIIILGFICLIAAVLVAGSWVYQSLDDIGYHLKVTLPANLMSFSEILLLGKGRMKLLDEVVENLKHLSSRPQAEREVSSDPREAYLLGLTDGATELAKYILSELKEEK